MVWWVNPSAFRDVDPAFGVADLAAHRFIVFIYKTNGKDYAAKLKSVAYL